MALTLWKLALRVVAEYVEITNDNGNYHGLI